MFSRLKKYFKHCLVEVSATDLVAGSLTLKESAEYFVVKNVKNEVLKDKVKTLIPQDKFGMPAGDRLRVDFEGLDGIESTLTCYDREGRVVSNEQVQMRILEVELLMRSGRVPPDGFRVSVESGLLAGRRGVVVGRSDAAGEEHRVKVRFGSLGDDSYILELDVKDCRLTSGDVMNLPRPGYKLIFGGQNAFRS